MSKKEELQKVKQEANHIWSEFKRKGIPLNQDQKRLMLQAYWESLTPKDSDYSVDQWVEDGMHNL